jgi:tetratricopeptide (TPR) repeat protein
MRYLLICLCPLLFWGNVNEEEALFLNRIADFWEEEEYTIARNQIHEFLALYPNSSSSDSLSSALGDLFLKEKNYTKALDSYEKIIDAKVTARIFPHKIQCYYALKAYDKLATECENYLQTTDDLQITYYLAIALYQQCLVAEEKENFISRATPYFEKLFTSSLKGQIAAPFAHLLCLQKNFPKAAEIYLETQTHDSLFQAALIQAEYDKELSLKTFESIKNSKPESAYNCLVLSFDLQKYEEIINSKDSILQTIPHARLPMAHLFFGRSFLALQRYTEAVCEIEKYIAEQSQTSDTLHAALLTLLDASLKTKDLKVVDESLSKIASFYPDDDSILKGKFSKALILRESNEFEKAMSELEALPKTKDVLIELIYLCNQIKDWTKAREYSLLALSQDPDNQILKNYFIHSVTALANANIDGKKQLIEDLKNVSSYLVAKTLFSLREYQQALPLLLEQSESEDVFLMIALCYRDGFKDLPSFCYYAEKAPLTGELHSALYNAYISLGNTELAVSHLFSAFQAGISISSENLFWLSQRLNPNDAVVVLESIENKTPETMLALGKLYHLSNRNEEAVMLLEGITELDEAALILGEIYARFGKTEEAQKLFAKVCQDSSSLKTYLGASACLQSIRLQKFNENPEKVLSQYKNLILQKNISNEPLYLEAALDYVAIQTELHGRDQAKKLTLLQKIKRDFETHDDLLSNDYHAARQMMAEQDAIYRSYMDFLEAEMLMTQSRLESDGKELQAKAKDILLKIVDEKAHPAIVERANQCLNP